MPSARLYFFVQRLFKCAARFLFRAKLAGVENIPKEGPFLLVTNHISFWDIPLMFIMQPRQMVMFCADKWRRVPGIREFCEMMGVIWVARGEADVEAIKLSLGHLKAGGILALAPEGTRSHSGPLQVGKTGAAYLADRTGVPIVPLAVWGQERAAGNLKRLRRTSVAGAFGEPFRLPPDGRAKGDKLEEFTEIIMCRLAALLPPDYRGAYADHPRLRQLHMTSEQQKGKAHVGITDTRFGSAT
jgi:1-acyl-sn-glycerol-3-phosphate acyltransferase